MSSKLISTTTGNSIVDSNSDVYVHVSGNRFVKKLAEDVNIGDQVLFRKEFVTTTIDDVDPVLDRSLRYRHAKQTMHEENKDGVLIPKQRTFLIRGLAKQGIVGGENLESKILKEAPDFINIQYDAMKEEVFNLINPEYIEGQKETRNRKIEQIDNWLKGKTVAIRDIDWHLYKNLHNLNSDFKKFNDSDNSKSSYWSDYKFMNTVKRTIMRYLAKCKPQDDASNNKPNKNKDKKDLSPEIKLVLDHFMQDIDEQYVAARVTNISYFSDKHLESRNKDKSRSKLSAGVVTNKTGSKNVEEIGMKELYGEYKTLYFYFQDIFYSFVKSHFEEKGYPKDKWLRIANYMGINIFSIFDEQGKFNEGGFQLVKDLSLTPLQKETIQEQEKLIEPIRESLFDGKLDKELNWSNGTYLKLYESVFKLKKATPNDLSLHYLLSCHLSWYNNFDKPHMMQDFLSEISKKLKNLEKNITNKYNFKFSDKHDFISPKLPLFFYLRSTSELVAKFNKKFEETGDLESLRKNDKEDMVTTHLLENKDFYIDLILKEEKKGNVIVERKKEVQKILDRHDLGEIINYMKDQFIYDNYLGESPSTPKIEEKPDSLEQKIKQEQSERKNRNTKFTKESNLRHRRIMEYIIENPAIIESGLKLITDEYRFLTNDRVDFLFQDKDEKFLTVELEYIASGDGGIAGLLQTAKYKHMLIVDQRLEPENTVRGMLVAVKISDEIKLLSKKYGYEYREIKVPEEVINSPKQIESAKVPKEIYKNLNGDEIEINNFSSKDNKIYRKITNFTGNGNFRDYYEDQLVQVYRNMSKNKLSKNKMKRLLEGIEEKPIHQIYLDIEKRLK